MYQIRCVCWKVSNCLKSGQRYASLFNLYSLQSVQGSRKRRKRESNCGKIKCAHEDHSFSSFVILFGKRTFPTH